MIVVISNGGRPDGVYFIFHIKEIQSWTAIKTVKSILLSSYCNKERETSM
jgi:hypothetical protein